MARFREILKNKNFFLLWLSQIISQFGDRLNQMALIAFIYSRAPGSTWAMAKLFSFTILPVFLFGPVAGVYVDRWSKQRTLFVSDLIRTLLVFTIAFFIIDLEPIFPLYLLIFLVFSVGRFFVPAKLSIIPDLVKKGDLLLANSLINTTGMIAAMFGLGIGGLLVSPNVLGVKGGFYLDSSTFFISAIMIYFITERISLRVSRKAIAGVSKDIVDVIRKSVATEIKEGLIFLVKKHDTRYVSAVFFMLGSFLGAVYVTFVVFVQEVLGSATAQLGLLAIFLGVGLFFGSLLYGRLGQGLSHIKVILSSLCLSGITICLFTILTYTLKDFLVAAFLCVVLGLTLSPIIIASHTLVHKLSDATMMGRIFSSLDVVFHLGILLAMFISASLAEILGRFWILIGVGFIIILFGVIGILRESRRHV